MSVKNNFYYFGILIIICGSLTDVGGSDFENLSYSREVLSGAVPPYSPPKTTPAPIEVTTQKSGFFSGIKNFFSRSSTEAPAEVTTTTTTTTTPRPPVQPPLSPKQPTTSRDYVNPNVKPGLNPIRSDPTQFNPVQPTSPQPIPTQSNRRDYINPNVKPGVNPIRNEPFSGPVQPSSSQSTPQSNRRDYVNPNSGTSTIPVHSPIISPGSPSISVPTTSSTVTPGNRRDYVAPVRPTLPNRDGSTSTNNIPTYSPTGSRRDYVNPNAPTAHSPIQPIQPYNPAVQNPTPTPPSNRHSQPTGGRRDYVNPNIGSPTSTDNFPALPSPRKPPVKEDFPALPAPKHPSQHPTPTQHHNPPNNAWTGKPGGGSSSSPAPNSVTFVPHQPGSSGGGSDRNQLATDAEIATLTENLLSKDANNQNSHITLNLQGRTRSIDRTDEAPNKLMEVDDVALQSPTIAKMQLLFNNYELDTLVNEYVTPNERKEENDFLDAVMATTVMRQAMQFLQNKGLVSPDPKTHRDLVKTIWFTMYSRGQGRIGSSAFEHVFLTELKNGSVIGLHNWVYYNEAEKNGHIDYKGYIKKVDLGTKGSILKYRFDLDGIQKPVNSLFIGTSPELEMALYTVCFQLRPDKDCPISLNGNRVNIITHTWRYRGKSLIGSAFPEI